jgi:hypothetical protein
VCNARSKSALALLPTTRKKKSIELIVMPPCPQLPFSSV